jgi:membrane-associated phospholipid phosphatase
VQHVEADSPRHDLTPPRDAPILRLEDLAPDDPWREVRWALLAIYGLVFAWSFEVNGLPIARLAVLAWVAAAFVLGNVGRPVHLQQRMVTDLVLYALMWLSYDYSRGIADTLGMPLQVEAPRNIDRVMFLGVDPNTWMQNEFYSTEVVAGVVVPDVRWYDVAGSLIYFSHFFVPVAASVYLWITYRPEWVRYIRRFATVLFAGVATYALLPTAPPWMASSEKYPYQLMEPLARPTGNGWRELGLESVNKVLIEGQQWSNPTAAMPSLHAAFSLLPVLFFFTIAQGRAARWVLGTLAVLFPLSMTLTLVYFGEHYVIDILVGFAYVGAAFWFWGRWEQRGRTRRAGSARTALGAAS